MRKINYSLIFLVVGMFISSDVYAAKKILGYADVVKQNMSLRQELRQQKKERVVIKNERDVLIQHLRKLQREGISKLRLENDSLKGKLAGSKKDIEVCKEKIERSKEKLKLARKDFNHKREEFKIALVKKDEEIFSIKKRETEWIGKFKLSQDEKLQLAQKIKRFQEDKKGLDGEIENYKQVLVKKEEEIIIFKENSAKRDEQEEARLKEAIEDIKKVYVKEKNSIEEEKQVLKSKIQQLEKTLSGIQVEFSDREEKLKIEKESFKESLARVVEEMVVYRQKVQGLEGTVQELTRKEVLLEEELQEHFSKRIQQQETIEELQLDKLSIEAKLAKQAEKTEETAREIAEKKINDVKKKADKERVDMHYNLAVVFDKNGMYEDSEREYLKCLRISPDDSDVHYNLAILYDDKLNKNLAAIRHYEKYLEFSTKGEEVFQVRQWILRAEQEERIGAEMR